jgi:hypothetical protein
LGDWRPINKQLQHNGKLMSSTNNNGATPEGGAEKTGRNGTSKVPLAKILKLITKQKKLGLNRKGESAAQTATPEVPTEAGPQPKSLNAATPPRKPALASIAQTIPGLDLAKMRLQPTPLSSTSSHIDVASLRLSPDFALGARQKRVTTVVQLRKPKPTEFVRVREGTEWCLDTFTVEERKQCYLIAPSLWDELAKHRKHTYIFTAMSRQAELYLWPINCPIGDGKHAWFDSHLAAITSAQKQWTQMAWDWGKSIFDVTIAEGHLPDPQWPDLTFEQIVNLCFGDRVIDSLDHPVVRRQRGLE